MKLLQLPIELPVYQSCRAHFCVGIAAAQNPTLRFWYCNNTVLLRCFFEGGALSDMMLDQAGWQELRPLVEVDTIPAFFWKAFCKETVASALENGYYVLANNVLEGQACLVSGYNDFGQMYTVSSYCFKEHTKLMSYADFYEAISRQACEYLMILKPTYACEEINAERILTQLHQYLQPQEIPSESGDGVLLGIDLYDVVTSNLQPQLFRLFCEHKECMAMRIKVLEDLLQRDHSVSDTYSALVKELKEPSADLLMLKTREKKLLEQFLS